MIENMIIREQDFTMKMEQEVLPFIKEKIKREYVTTHSGVRLSYEYMLNPDAKGTIVVSHGYCEFASKYYEVIYYFYKMGYSVFVVEHRGHGYSDRLVEGFSKVHIDHFQTYVDDFHSFIIQGVLKKSNSEHLYLYCHSMGGAVGALYLEQHPDIFEKAILSSPMIKMATGNTNKIVLDVVKLASYLPFMNRRYIHGHHDYDGTYKYPKCSAISEPRYKFQYDQREADEHYRTNGASNGWSREAINVYKKIIKNAKSVQIPVILFQASEDALVKAEGQNEFARLSGNTQLIRVEGCKHEIYNGTDEMIIDYYKKIFEFLG